MMNPVSFFTAIEYDQPTSIKSLYQLGEDYFNYGRSAVVCTHSLNDKQIWIVDKWGSQSSFTATCCKLQAYLLSFFRLSCWL